MQEWDFSSTSALLSPDKRRNVGMHLHGHQFLADTMVDPERNAEGVESLQNPSYSRIHETRVSDFKGDWCYRSSALFQMGGHGLWGILRVDPHAANFDTCYATPEGERIDLLYNPPGLEECVFPRERQGVGLEPDPNPSPLSRVGGVTPRVDILGPKAAVGEGSSNAAMGVSTWAHPANDEGRCPPPCAADTEQ